MSAMSRARPDTAIRGRQVIVRRYSVDDAPLLQDAVVESLDHLLPWMPWASLEPLKLSDRIKLIADWNDRWEDGEDFTFGVFEADRLVGGCGMHRRGVGQSGVAIGYWTRAGETGRGVATDAAACLVNAAFKMSAMEFVEVHNDVANIASARVPELLGFGLVAERAVEVEAPAEVGVEQVWRLDRPE